MKFEIRRIEPWSAVKIGFFMGIPLGFFFGLYTSFMIKNLASLGGAPLPAEAQELGSLAGMNSIVLAIMTALFSSLVCAFIGAISAMFYNLIAKYFGGVELALDGEVPAQPHRQNSIHDSTDDDSYE